jgi:hypothetical protein
MMEKNRGESGDDEDEDDEDDDDDLAQKVVARVGTKSLI